MKNKSPDYSEVFVDGQPFIVPSKGDLETILTQPYYLGLLVYKPTMQRLKSNMINFVLEHEQNFSFGLCYVKWLPSAWFTIILLKTAEGYQRVHVEYPRCGNCGWRGAIANPTVSDIYSDCSAEDELSALKKVWSLPRLGCPSCGAMLERFAIWTAGADEVIESA